MMKRKNTFICTSVVKSIHSESKNKKVKIDVFLMKTACDSAASQDRAMKMI